MSGNSWHLKFEEQCWNWILSHISMDVHCPKKFPLSPCPQTYKQKAVGCSIPLGQCIWLNPNHRVVMFQRCRNPPPGGHYSLIFVSVRWWSMRFLAGKHEFIIMLKATGRRPSDTSHLDEGIFCFWCISICPHSLCGGVNILISIIIGAQGGPPTRSVTNDRVAQFLRTTAILIFLIRSGWNSFTFLILNLILSLKCSHFLPFSFHILVYILELLLIVSQATEFSQEIIPHFLTVTLFFSSWVSLHFQQWWAQYEAGRFI